MSLGIYKPGQGYWTRVLTAVGLGVLCLTGIIWLWNQVGANFPVPINSWNLTLAAPSGDIAPGQQVRFYLNADAAEPIGTALVQSVDDTGRSMMVNNVAMTGSNTTMTINLVSADGYDAAVSNRIGIPAYNVLYIQAAMAAALLVLAAILIYLIVGTRQRTNEFFIAVDTEMRKVNWSTRREIIGSTTVVIAVCFVLTGVLFAVDLAFGSFFQAIGILKQ